MTDIKICFNCRRHDHGSCWKYLAAVGVYGYDTNSLQTDTHTQMLDCPCECHPDPASKELTDEALYDMQKHGTLVEWVKLNQIEIRFCP